MNINELTQYPMYPTKMQGTHFFIKKNYRQDNLSYWIEKKQMKCYVELLENVAETLALIFPEDQTSNQNIEINQSLQLQIKPSHYKVYEKLVHGLTLLNHPFRVLKNGYYLSAKEDAMLSARLLQPAALPKTLIRKATKETYQKILENFNYNPFTIKEVQFKLLIPKSTIQKHIYALLHANYLEKIGGNQNKGFIYRIK